MKTISTFILLTLLTLGALAQTSIKGRVCNIRDFGAIGNDSTDNTTAISSAITVCQTAGGGTVWIPAGIYRTQPITQNLQGVTFQGDSELTAILKPVNANEPIFNVTGAGYSLYVTIQNIGLTGRGKTSGSSGHCAVFGSLTPNQEAAYFTIRNVYIKECGGKGLYMPGQFTTLIEAVDTDEIGDNHIEIQGGNTTTLVRNYVHTVEAGKVGYRIHGGDVTLIGNNGVDPDSSVISLWGIFGDQTSLDGSDSYFRGTLIGNNIEDIGDQGLDFREGSYGTFSGNTFTTKSSGNHIVARFRYVDASDAQGVWNGNNRVILTGGAYTSGAAIHSQGTPFTQVGNASFTQYYDTSLATLITLPTVTSGLVSGSSNSALKLSRAQITALESSGLVGTLTGASDYTGATSKIRLQDGTASLPVFGNTSSSTTGMYFPSGTGVGFTVGGSQKLSLGSSVHQFTGDVGFGVSPSYPIDVVANGGAIAQQWRETGAGTTRVQLQIPASYGQIGTSSNHAFALITNGTQRVNVEATGGTVFGSIVPATATVMVNALNALDTALIANNASGSSTSIATFQVNASNRFRFLSTGEAIFGLPGTITGKLTYGNSTNSNTISFQAGATASNLTFTWPTTDSTGTQCLASNGSGTLSWTTCSGGGGGTPGGSDTQVQYNNAGSFGGISGFTSNGTNVTAGSGNLTATRPKFITSIDDTNGNEVFGVTATASAVNEFTVANAATGNAPVLSATGGDTNIGITLTPKGTGTVFVNQNGTTSVPGLAVGASNIGFSNANSALQFLYSGSAVAAAFANGLKTFDSGRIDWSGTSATSGTTDLALSRFAANTMRVGGDAVGSTAGKLFVSRSDKTMQGWLTVDGDTSNTNAIATFGSFGLDSTGTAAAGLGARLLLAIESTTTNQTTAGAIDWAWNIATHASRNAYVSISAQGTSTLAEVARFQGLASAVNYFNFFPSTTGNTVEMGAEGGDADIGINLAPKGTGVVTVNTVPVLTETNVASVTDKTITDSSNTLGSVTMDVTGTDANGDIYYRASGVLTRLGIGTAGQCLLVNAGATAPEWGSCGGGGGGANTALSNLASVAINTTLVSDTDNTDDLGSTTIRWRRVHTVGGIYGTTTTPIIGTTSTGSAVNYVDVQNAATGLGPQISAVGSDSNIRLTLQSKGAEDVRAVYSDSTTNTTDTVFSLVRNSTGTPANNIGAANNFYIGTSTTPTTLAGGIGVQWVNATHASRTSRMFFNTVDASQVFSERMGVDHNGIRLPEISSAATPAANNVYVYAKDNGSGVSKLYYKGDDGTEVGPLAAGGGSVNPTSTIIPYNNAGTFADTNLSYASNVTTLTNNLAANTSGDGWVLTNTGTASSGNQMFSPRLRLTGQGWKTNATAASQTVDWIIENQPVQGAANPTTNLVISSQVSAGGYTSRLSLTSGGQTIGGDGTAALPAFAFSGGTTTGLYRAATGVVGVSSSGGAALGIYSSGIIMPSSSFYSFSSSGSVTTAGDTIIRRAAAANLAFGATDAASPVAQTISVQNVAAGTSNTAGANWTINGSRGTGTGNGGQLIFQTAPAGSSGTSQNTLVTAMTIASDGVIYPKPYTHANLPTPVNGDGGFVYCSDCTIASPCASGGTGALAKRLNGAWVCN